MPTRWTPKVKGTLASPLQLDAIPGAKREPPVSNTDASSSTTTPFKAAQSATLEKRSGARMVAIGE
jgi:hypothetical protein